MEQVKTYGDIVERIMEIIRLSEQKRTTMDSEELKEHFNEHFAYILYSNIDVALVSEFRELIDAERTFCLMKNASPINCLDKTKELLEICKDNSVPQNNNCFYYEEIVQIISDSYGKSAFDLTEYKGYYILREKVNRWLWLMRKLDLLPDERKMNDAERKNEVNRILYENYEQYNRLQSYLEQAKKQSDTSSKENNNVIDFSEYSGFKPTFKNRKFGDLVLVGLNGGLTKDTIKCLRFLYSDADYEQLLTELSEWQIFNQNEIEEFRNIPKDSIMITDSMEQLLMFFVNSKIQVEDANALRLLQPAIGRENLMTFLNILYMSGSIPTNVYEEYLTLETGVETKIMKKF